MVPLGDLTVPCLTASQQNSVSWHDSFTRNGRAFLAKELGLQMQVEGCEISQFYLTAGF